MIILNLKSRFQAVFEFENLQNGSCRKAEDVGFGNTGRMRIQPAIRAERKSPAREDTGHFGGRYIDFSENQTQKEQGRRRSITLTALPAPDIEIGSRRPGEPHLAPVSYG